MKSFFSKLYDKKISSKGLSIFRIFFCTVLFFEVIHIYRFRQLYYDPIPFINPAHIDMQPYLLLWMVALIFLTFGFFTRLAAIVNYFFVVFVFSSIGAFEYHMDYLYTGISFLMIFAPLSRSYSVDRFLKKRTLGYKTLENKFSQKVPVIFYYLFIIVGISFVYFDSGIFKLKSEMWQMGLGVWLPASLTPVTILNDQWLLNQEFLIKFLGYFTMLFELFFAFFFFVKRLRWILFFIGFGLHIGILLEFPIPYFALGVMSLYMLMVPVNFWDFLERTLHRKIFKLGCRKELTVVADNKPSTDIHKFRNLKIYFSTIVTLMLFLFQFNSLFNFPLSKGIVREVTTRYESSVGMINSLQNVKNNVRHFSAKYLGIAPHGVFIDEHFEGYNKIYSLTHEGMLLPMYDEFGMPGPYLVSGSWANFNFRVNKPNVLDDVAALEKGLIRYAAFWAFKNNVHLNSTKFTIIKKEVDGTFKWEKNLLQKNRAKPWVPVGELKWNHKKAVVHLSIDK